MKTEHTKSDEPAVATTVRLAPSIVARVDAVGKARGDFTRSATFRWLLAHALDDFSRITTPSQS
jgi:hypothetical protein